MAESSSEMILSQLLAALKEGIEGGTPPATYYIDAGPEFALTATLAKLSAKDASEVRAGSSIVAQTVHLLFGLRVSAEWIRGERNQHSWAESWSPKTLDEAGWKKLQNEVLQAYHELRKAIETNGLSGAESFGGAVGAIAHVAYHLGAIRQKVAMVCE